MQRGFVEGATKKIKKYTPDGLHILYTYILLSRGCRSGSACSKQRKSTRHYAHFPATVCSNRWQVPIKKTQCTQLTYQSFEVALVRY